MRGTYQERLDNLRASGRLRELKPLSGRSGCRVNYGGRSLLNLSSNDYLGLAGDIELHKNYFQTMEEEKLLDEFGMGAASSRLLTGDNNISHRLEQTLRENYNKEACLLFNSGYHANIGILPALLDKKDLILSDKLNHASITDGMRLSRSEFKRYRHCDYDHLRWLLNKFREEYDQVIIVSESVFSMDGDIVNLARLVELKKEFDCLLYLDEAHGVGLYGDNGLGIAEQQSQIENIDLLVGTFGKAYASVGAFVLCTATIREFLVNTSRSLVFTTALPPVTTNWNSYIFNKALSLNKKREHLGTISGKLRDSLRANGLQTDGATNIVPVMLGEDQLAVALGKEMQDSGYLIFPVRPPTVPEGTSRFRLSLTADMTWQDLQNIAPAIASCLKRQKEMKL